MSRLELKLFVIFEQVILLVMAGQTSDQNEFFVVIGDSPAPMHQCRDWMPGYPVECFCIINVYPRIGFAGGAIKGSQFNRHEDLAVVIGQIPMMTGHIYFVQNFSGEIGFDQLHCVRPKNEMPVRRDTLKVPAISALTFYP